MVSGLLTDISQAQQERLAFIEFRLLFLGSASRPDLARRFGVSEYAASRDFALYRQLAPDNLFYDRSIAVYLPGEELTPLFEYQPVQVLTALAEGFGGDFVTVSDNWLPTELPSSLQATYCSLSSGQSEKMIVPLALVDNGLRWHVRAYEPEHSRYADFVLTRILCAENINSADNAQQLREQDIAWQQYLDLELVPHPQLKHPGTVALEYGMTDHCLRLSVRAAVAGYLLRRWNVDCTPKHRLQGPENLLWLRNAEQLQREHSLFIAPGFTDAGQHKHTEALDAEA